MTPSAHQSDRTNSPAVHSSRARRLCFSLVICAAVIAIAGAWPEAQGQPPGQGGGGRGIQANEHPVLPIGSALPEFSLPGVDGKMHKSSEYRRHQGAGRRLREQSLPRLAAVREPHREDLRGLSPQGRHARRDQPEQRQGGSTQRARIYGRHRLAAGNEDSRGVPRHRVAVPLRRRDPGALDEVRCRRHSAHLPLRPGSQAALSGPDRRQPARGAGQDARRARCARRPARGPAGCRRRDAGVRMHDEVDEQVPGRHAGVGEDQSRAGDGRDGRAPRS